MIELVALDADDTLWHSQNHYDDAQRAGAELVADWADADTFSNRLLEIERVNITRYGFGVKSFTMSMIETAIDLSGHEIGTTAIASYLAIGKSLLDHPVELIDGVAETVATLAGRFPLAVITKGDLRHQRQKIDESGLARYFTHVHIVSDKSAETYRAVVGEIGVPAERTVMAGNSIPSDVLPAQEAGMHAVHIPYALLWSYEHGHAATGTATLDSIIDLPDYIEGIGGAP